MDIHSINRIFMQWFRPRRAEQIRKAFPCLADPYARILDVGGGAYPWQYIDPAAQVTVLNLSRPRSLPADSKWKFVIGNGTKLCFADQSFDLVFSNSVIEHVGDASDQRRFAAEILRVGRSIYCQTPNRWFPVEPHLMAIFVHWLPTSVQRRTIRWLSVWGIVTKPTRSQIDTFIRDTRLLSRKEVEALFPDCSIKVERVCGLSKSFIAMRVQ